MVNTNDVEELVPADRLVPLRYIRPGLVCHDCEFAIPASSWSVRLRDREPQPHNSHVGSSRILYRFRCRVNLGNSRVVRVNNPSTF